jgi:hypothetical protein
MDITARTQSSDILSSANNREFTNLISVYLKFFFREADKQRVITSLAFHTCPLLCLSINKQSEAERETKTETTENVGQ